MWERLASPCYADDSEYQRWCGYQIDTLTAHMSEIQRYLKEGGTLRLPLCCKDESQTLPDSHETLQVLSDASG